MFLLDTDTVSQLSKMKPNPATALWLKSRPTAELYLSVITLYEIKSGVESLPLGKRRNNLKLWLENDLRLGFRYRIIPVSEEIALDAGYLTIRAKRSGFNIATNDVLLAATARTHNLAVATLNRRDFQHLEVPLVDFRAANF